MQSSFLELEERRRVEGTSMQRSGLELEEYRRRFEDKKDAKKLLRARGDKESWENKEAE